MFETDHCLIYLIRLSEPDKNSKLKFKNYLHKWAIIWVQLAFLDINWPVIDLSEQEYHVERDIHTEI